MNYPEYHSHKWAKNLKEAVQRAQRTNEFAQSGMTDNAKAELALLYQGDFND